MPTSAALLTAVSMEELWLLVQQQFRLPDVTIHGPRHWKKVEANGLLLARHSGADEHAVRLFAVLHDSQREDDDWDRDHGRRGAAFARSLGHEYLGVDLMTFHQLVHAIAYHADGQTCDDLFIGTCWDADRLDLIRCGTMPDERLMNTPLGKQLARRGHGW